MRTLEDGAKMLIVAWVKDWNMRTLFHVLMDKDEVTEESIKELTTHYPFMPLRPHWYLANRGRGLSAQTFVAAAYPKLNDKLFDASSNEVRLKNAPYLMKQVAGDVRVPSKFSKNEQKEKRKEIKEYKQAVISYNNSRENFKKCHRGAWNVIK